MRRVNELILRLVGIRFWCLALCRPRGRRLFARIHGLLLRDPGDFLRYLWTLLAFAPRCPLRRATSRRCCGDRLQHALRLRLLCWRELSLRRNLGLDFEYRLGFTLGFELVFWAARRHGNLQGFRNAKL